MFTEFVYVWQREYGGHREVEHENEMNYDDLVRGCGRTVENHGGVINLYEINNDGQLRRVRTFGKF